MATDPDLELNPDSTDLRLVPLDPWERNWIAGAVRSALSLSPLMPPSAGEAHRMNDLLVKMRFRNVPIEPN
jgi:hypothetical protein